MKKKSIVVSFLCFAGILLISRCAEKQSETEAPKPESAKTAYGGYGSPEKWGEHLVIIQGCHDCHTPKKMTAQGPVLDSALLLSGHPAQAPAPDINRKEIESKGLTVTNDLTAWVGAWGISYTANLTSDSTGIGNWKEEQFIYAIREGKLKGLAASRSLLPPMPWPMLRNMNDDELKAIFAYLKTTKPVKNVVPQPQPPISEPMVKK